MQSFYTFIALVSFHLLIECYHTDAEIAHFTQCDIETTSTFKTSCHIQCDASTTDGIIRKLNCSNVDHCIIHCVSKMCMINSIIYAENVGTLQIISSASHCLSNSTIYLPHHGSATIRADTASYSFASNRLYSGSDTNIDIYCNGNNISNIDNICDNLWLNASTAHELNIKVTSTSANRAYIVCPHDINSICIINATDAIMENVFIIATHDVSIYIDAQSDFSHSSVQCNNVMTIFDTTTFFDNAQCVANNIYDETTFYPITLTELPEEHPIMDLFQSTIALKYVLVTISTLIICICCAVFCIKCGANPLKQLASPKQQRETKAATIIDTNFRDDRILSVGSEVDLKQILELAKTPTLTTTTSPPGTMDATHVSPPMVSINDDHELDHVDIIIRDHIYDEVPWGGFSAPCHAVSTIVEDGKNIDMDVFKSTSSPRSLNTTTEHNSKHKNMRKISDYLQTKFAKKSFNVTEPDDEITKPRCLSESQRGFTVNKLYTIYQQKHNRLDDTEQKGIDETEQEGIDEQPGYKRSEGNESVISEASTFTIRSGYSMMDDRVNMEGNMLTETNFGIHVVDEVDEEESEIDAGIEDMNHFRSKTEGSETKTNSLKLPPKVTKGAYL